MSKLFFVDNNLRRLSQRIPRVKGRKLVDDSVMKVLFVKREKPDPVNYQVYGREDINYYDNWRESSEYNRYSYFDAHVKISDIAFTVPMQELINISERLAHVINRQNMIIMSMAVTEFPNENI
jgi:hypothetical protein